MKKILVLLNFLFIVAIGTAQIPDMRTKLVYNTNDCRYEVYVTPSASTSSFNMGGSQIVIAVPHNLITIYPTTRRSAFAITTVAPQTNSWSVTAFADMDQLGTYSGSFDYYAVDNDGGALGPLTANQDILLFHFKLGQNCINGLRLWEGVGATPNLYSDPKYPIGGGDFQTNISLASGISYETWVGNSVNTPTVLPLPSVTISEACNNPAPSLHTITANVVGGDHCNPYQYSWTTTGTWLIPPGTTSTGYISVCPAVDSFYVTVMDGNGCVATSSLEPSSLPVEFILFTVTKEENDALLNWATATEVNNNYFDVEHSTDAENFTQVGRVFSKNGNSTSVQNYNFRHDKTSKGINYYRLKQVDFDGSFEYTDIRSVVFGTHAGLNIFPNPTTDKIQVEIPVGIDKDVVVEIVNAAGQLVRSVRNPAQVGNILTLNVEDLALGYYFIQLRTTSDLFREQFIITK